MKDLKKYTKVLLATATVSAAMMAAPATVHAMKGTYGWVQTDPVDGGKYEYYDMDTANIYTFSINSSKKTATLTSATNLNDDEAIETLDVPGAINASGTIYNVTALSAGVLANKPNVTTINLADTSITAITNKSQVGGFTNDTKLESVQLPETLT